MPVLDENLDGKNAPKLTAIWKTKYAKSNYSTAFQ